MKIKKESLKQAIRRKRKRRKPLIRNVRYAHEEIKLQLDIKKGRWVAVSDITMIAETKDHIIFGEGESVKEAIEDYINKLDNLMRSCSDSLAMGIELADHLDKIYKYFTE